jgi:hypothetical protein
MADYHASAGYLKAILYNSEPSTKPTFGCVKWEQL